jgi:acyl-coenzyme A thioesterase PaaI-like protein
MTEDTLVRWRAEVLAVRARLAEPDGKLYAHGTTTCLVFEQP